jgi:hypothetical protein
MSQQNIYPVQLLNDLHNHFPDVLYNPGRFRHVQDLLDYIRQVADVNPWSRGLNMYNNRQSMRGNMGVRQNGTNIPTYPPVGPVRTTAPAPPVPSRTSVNNATWLPTVVATTVIDESDTGMFHPITGLANGTTAGATTVNSLLSNIISEFMNSGGTILNAGLGEGRGFQSFLDQRVPIRATQEQINDATTIHRVTTQQDDICAICQENIDSGQEMRELRHCHHYFHRDCIDTWFQGNVLCPTCRHDIREVEVNNPPPVPDNHRRTNIRGDN